MSKKGCLVSAVGLVLLLVAPAAICEPVRFGIEGGPTYSSADFDVEAAVTDKSGLTSFTVGAFAEIPLGDWRSFFPGIRYVREGHSVTFNTGANDPELRQWGDVDINHSYLSVPILLKVTLLEKPRFFFKAGPDVMILVSASANGREYEETEFTKIIVHKDDDIQTDMRRFCFSVDLGGGVEFPVGRHVGSVELRYDYGVEETAKAGRFFSNWRTNDVEALFGLTW